MTDFEHKDLDGDRLQVVAMQYPASSTPGWLFRVLPRDGGKHLSAWVPASAATGLGDILSGDRVNRTRISVGVNTVESLHPVAEVASIDWAIGEHTIRIEGRTAGEVASALRVALGDHNNLGTLDELAELLDCDPAELLVELRDVIEQRDQAEAQAEQRRGEVASLQGLVDQLQTRPTTSDLQIAKRAADHARADLKALQAAVDADRNGITELRRQLLAFGLQGMSTATLADIASAINRLGQENNRLREVNSRGGQLDDLQRQYNDLREEHAALQLIDKELQRAIEHERELRKRAERGRDEWIERHGHEVTTREALQVELRDVRRQLGDTRAQAEATQEFLGVERRQVAVLNDEVTRLKATIAELLAERQDAAAAQRYLDMLREALQETRSEFVNADTEEVEAADLSSERAALIVAKIDRALNATA